MAQTQTGASRARSRKPSYDLRKPNADWDKLDSVFRRKLEAVFADLAGRGIRLRLVEGWRSQQRQAWLYASGRTRPGPILTYADGRRKKSAHQLGVAADVYFEDADGKAYLPPWNGQEETLPREFKLLRSSARAHGLVWGGEWKMRDTPHLELKG